MTSSIFNVQTRADINGLEYQPAGVIFAVEGTAYPGAPGAILPITNDGTGWWAGFASGVIGGLENVADGLWGSIIISYEASTIPMWPSVLQGREYLVQAILNYANGFYARFGFYPPIVLIGYSQGSMVTDLCFLYDFLAAPGGTDPDGIETGRLHHVLPFLYRSYQFGHVFRTPAIAHLNAKAGLPESITQNGVESGGIGGVKDLTAEQTNTPAPDEQPIVQSAANHGDIYTCSPCGPDPQNNIAPQGKTGVLFFKIVMQPTFADIVEAAEVLEHPIASIEEGLNAGTFFAEGPGAPHYQYYPQMLTCITDLVALGNSLPRQIGC